MFISPLKFIARKGMVLAEMVFGVTIYRTLPRGIDPLHDLKLFLPGWLPSVIFDIGANVGQSAMAYSKHLPSAAILSFEPAAETFNQLTINMMHFPNVRCFKCAFGSGEGTAVLALNSSNHSCENRLIEKDSPAAMSESFSYEVVDQKTVDGFCRDLAIRKINYLKIDTEGSDLAVLHGATEMLRNSLIDVIEVEVGIGRDNDLHVPMQEVRTYLESFGYLVFGFYEQVNEWKRRLPHLRRTNMVFISERVEKGNE